MDSDWLLYNAITALTLLNISNEKISQQFVSNLDNPIRFARIFQKL